MREQSCGSCRFWLSRPVEGSSSEGLCRRCSPTAHTWVSATRSSAETLTMAQFPPMEADSWCGEWQAIDDGRILLSPGRTAAAISPPPRTAAPIDAPDWDDTPREWEPPEWENDSVDFVDAAMDEPDAFDAILKTDDTELWESAVTLDGTTTAASVGSVTGDTALDDSTVAADERVILAPESLVAEAPGTIGAPREVDAQSSGPSPDESADVMLVDSSAAAEDEVQVRPPAGFPAGAPADTPTAPNAEPVHSWLRSDISLPIDDATATDAAVENAPEESSSDADHRDSVSEFPDPAEWPNDYSGADAGPRGADGKRPPAKASPSGNGGDEWPDWSEWLQAHSGGELRLDNVVGPADEDGETGKTAAAGGEKSSCDPAGESMIDDPEPGSGSPIPDPPPWLNEPPKPGFLGWARRTWR